MKNRYFTIAIALTGLAPVLVAEPLFHPVIIAPRPALPSPAFDPVPASSLEPSIRVVPAPVPVVVAPVTAVPVEAARPVTPAPVASRR